MNEQTFRLLNYDWMILAAMIFIVLLKVTAPFGRHTSPKWGPMISNRLGWMFMELPGMTLVLYFILSRFLLQNIVSLTLASFYVFHYVNRALVFPFRIHTRGKKMPLVVALMAVCFNLMNGFLIGYYFGEVHTYSSDYFLTINFIAGTVLFIAGLTINWKYDNRLIHLRKASETGYVIPSGGLFDLISCPNLFGEILEWGGFALLCWNLPALSFFVWTFANLIPRAISHHRWYRQQFPDYPKRKAVIPFLL